MNSGFSIACVFMETFSAPAFSNFLIWQSIYTEIFFIKKMWPEFTEKDYYRIIDKFKSINRNFGGLNEKFR